MKEDSYLVKGKKKISCEKSLSWGSGSKIYNNKILMLEYLHNMYLINKF